MSFISSVYLSCRSATISTILYGPRGKIAKELGLEIRNFLKSEDDWGTDLTVSLPIFAKYSLKASAIKVGSVIVFPLPSMISPIFCCFGSRCFFDKRPMFGRRLLGFT